MSEKASALKSRNTDLQTWLFVLALVIYLTTRLVGLSKFPIYFFTDEAIQAVAAADLVDNKFRDPNGNLLPTYFENGSQYNLSLSVYWQILPNLLFGRSVGVTRGSAVMGTLLAAVFIGMILRDFFRVRHWWLGPLVLAATPTWFLHSRTAFETSLMASMYAAFVFFYLSYRHKNPKHLVYAIVFGALTFYAYSPGQVVIVVTCIGLFFTDLRYHWQERRIVFPALAVLVILTIPYFRFQMDHSGELRHHLLMLNSYWVKDISFFEKIGQYLIRYLKGFNPIYWYLPNDFDLIRHRMKDMGHFLLMGFPYALIGVALMIKYLNKSEYRTLLICLLASPSGAAIVDVAITRLLVMVIPATLITSMGIEWFLQNLAKYRVSLKISGVLTFMLIAATSGWLLFESLVHGPTWYDDYGLYGMQYGGEVLFEDIKQELVVDENYQIILSPSWANGTDVIARYYLGDPLPIELGSIDGYIKHYMPIKEDTVFIMLPNEYNDMQESGKFSNIFIKKELPCPDGSTCFIYVTFEYIKGIEKIFEEELLERQKLQEGEINLFGQSVKVQFSLLDINEISQAFDGNNDSLIRTFEVNPLRILLEFKEAVEIRGVSAIVGGEKTRVTVHVHSPDETDEQVLTQEVDNEADFQTVNIDFGTFIQVDRLEIDIFSVNDPELSHVHLWEISFSQ